MIVRADYFWNEVSDGRILKSKRNVIDTNFTSLSFERKDQWKGLIFDPNIRLRWKLGPKYLLHPVPNEWGNLYYNKSIYYGSF